MILNEVNHFKDLNKEEKIVNAVEIEKSKKFKL